MATSKLSPELRKSLDELALTPGEYQMILDKLDREPTYLELGLFGSLWSEHCGYKHSKPLLRLFPTKHRRVLQGPGENAGVVRITPRYSICMKVESHNHPSAIEPYQGAATGVGGIVRDIFTMGARPIALLNSLRFGPLTEPRNKHLFSGVVSGISGYGNCIGVPDVGGEVQFASVYSGNPLVNAMCVGLIEGDTIIQGKAAGPGNPIMLVGADTGRDGIHGASGLASRTFEDDRELRPTVQIGNPFLEKVLIEACLELAKTGHIVGMQDLGAAGLSSSIAECAYRAGTGIDIDVALVPRRAEGMTSYDVMLSESQERMLVIVKKGHEKDVNKIFDKWDLHSDIIGQVTDDGVVRIRDKGKIEAEIPAQLLVEAPQYRLKGTPPPNLKTIQNRNLEALPVPKNLNEVLLKLSASPNIASKRPIYRQYDHQVQDNTVVPPGRGDSAVLRLKGTRKGIALKTDGNGRYCFLDPFTGGSIAVAEAARNVVCTGAKPIAITDGLNFGNPDKPDVYWQMEECIKGMSAACKVLGVPVISGNVSLYNESHGEPIYPTPIVGALGVIDDIRTASSSAFRQSGDDVYLAGPDTPSLAGSEYLEVIHGLVAGKPSISLAMEKRVQRFILSAIKRKLVHSSHDCSDGGIAVALAESAILSDIGFKGTWTFKNRIDIELFGEGQSRVVISASPSDAEQLKRLAYSSRVPLRKLGVTGGKRFQIGTRVNLSLERLVSSYENGLQQALA